MRKRVCTVVFSLFITAFLFLISSSRASAATNVYFSPSSGSVGSEFSVSVVADSGTDEIAGIELDVNYTGPISYVSASRGAVCSSGPATAGSGTVQLTCFYDMDLIPEGAEGLTGPQTVYTLNFNSTGDGTANLSISNLVVGGSTTGTLGTATFSTSTTAQTGTGGLPTAGIFDEFEGRILVGFLIIALGVIVAVMDIRVVNRARYRFAGKLERLSDQGTFDEPTTLSEKIL